MMTVVCVYNNRELLERYLLWSLNRQTAPFELRLVDNTHGAFSSAAMALNHGAKKANGKYIVFAHQDVALATCDWLESVEKTLDSLQLLGIAGIAGKTKKGNYSYSNAEHAPFPKYAGKYRVAEPMKVVTLDECLFIIPTAVFEKRNLNDHVCNGWHLYAVEYCLRMLDEKLGVYVIPQEVYHWGGTQSKPWLQDDYYVALKRFLVYNRDRGRIPTTCGDWSTFIPVRIQRWKIWRYIWKIRPFLNRGQKIEHVIAWLTTTVPGKQVVRRCMREPNSKMLFDMARMKYYDALRAKFAPKCRLDGDPLYASDINEHLATLAMLTREMRLKRVLELGVDKGQSTLAFLNAAKDIGGKVTSMDITECQEAVDAVRNSGLESYWKFIVADDMMYDWHEMIDHLFIDTSHAYYHTLAELEKYEPYVRIGGVITMHDTVSFPGARRAIDEYLIGKRYLREYKFFNNHGLSVIFKVSR